MKCPFQELAGELRVTRFCTFISVDGFCDNLEESPKLAGAWCTEKIEEVEELEEKNDDLTDELSDAQADITRLNDEIAELEDDIDKLEDQKE